MLHKNVLNCVIFIEPNENMEGGQEEIPDYYVAEAIGKYVVTRMELLLELHFSFCKLILSRSVEEEIEKTKAANSWQNLEGPTRGLTVSGDGTWRKRGFSFLQRVSTIIGHYTGKVLDIIAKCSYCEACESWEDKKNSEEYLEWFEGHKESCSANHQGSAGKMEVDANREIFERSQKNYQVKYLNYVGDGDSTTYKGVVEAFPYGPSVEINKMECVGHVEKRMGARLRTCKKKTKGLGGRGKLTGELIDELTVYYGLAIKRNCDTVEKMKDAIWATFLHKSSTDDEPSRGKCPPGLKSWCSWQKAKASSKLQTQGTTPWRCNQSNTPNKRNSYRRTAVEEMRRWIQAKLKMKV